MSNDQIVSDAFTGNLSLEGGLFRYVGGLMRVEVLLTVCLALAAMRDVSDLNG